MAFRYVLGSIAACYFLLTVSIRTNNHGFVTCYSKVQNVIEPGLNFMSPICSVDEQTTGYDTDWTTDVQCTSRDNIPVLIKNVYVQNEWNCKSANATAEKECMIAVYKKYYLTDSKFKAKFNNKFVPEDGIIFKYLPEVLAPYCKQIHAYQMRSQKWTNMFPSMLLDLQEKVDPRIKLTGVRMDFPVFKNQEAHMKLHNIIAAQAYTLLVA
jgi:hypothetical protein